MTPRNLILIVIILVFLLGYGGWWAYTELYVAPRNRLAADINQRLQEIERGQENLAEMQQFYQQHAWLYQRTLPMHQNYMRQYSAWLWELLQLTDFDIEGVREHPPTRIEQGANFQLLVICTGTLEQLTYFLAEFYTAPFLHRIASLTIVPTDTNTDIKTFSMTINALALNTSGSPFQATNQLPTGRLPRMAYYDWTFYQVIAERNLLQMARGGIDLADFTVLTAIIERGGLKEVWFTNRLQPDDSPNGIMRIRLNGQIHAGSFVGTIVEIHDQDIVIVREDGTRWLLEAGESLSEAFALPPETATRME